MLRHLLYFFIFFSLFIFLGSIKINDANAVCSSNPSLQYINSTPGDWSVIYHLRLNYSNCSGSNTFNVRVTNIPIQGNWEVENAGNGNTYQFTANGSGSRVIDVTVRRRRDVFQPNGSYEYVVVRASLASNSNRNDVINLIYNVENKPDIEIVEFNYPNGQTCRTVDPTVRIRNTGWARITADFYVEVNNGGGSVRERRVTANLNHNQTANISSLFENMPMPPARSSNYTARLTVDSRGNGNIDEEGENNNTATDSYRSSACTSNTPTPTRSVTPTPTPNIPTPTPVVNAGKWIQSIGGDIREDHGTAFTNNVIPGTTNYFSQNSTSPVMTHGVVFLTSPFNLGSDPQNLKANSSRWLVTGTQFMPNPIKTSYSQTLRNMTRSGAWASATELFGGTNSPCGGNGPICNLRPNLAPGIYKTESIDRDVIINVTTPSYTFLPGNYIFVIKQDLNIDKNIIVPLGSTAIFIVGGDINVASNVTRMDGVYSTDNDFSIASNTSGPDEQLVINGNVIANAALRHKFGDFPGTLIGGRDLGTGNDTTPGVQVKIRPDFILNMPPLIRFGNFNRQEVAPGE